MTQPPFTFTITVTACSNCPHREDHLYGGDCNLNNGEWAMYNENEVHIWCPYRNLQAP